MGVGKLSVVALLLLAASTRGHPHAVQPDAAAARGDPRPLNVVLLVIDTLRADHLACYGYPRATSPNLDRFAQESVRFEHAYTAWPETCQSMAAMLSGLAGQTSGVVVDTPQAISTELELLPEILKGAGWTTAAFVMNSVLPRSNHFDQGIDHYVEVWNGKENPKRASDADLARAWLKQDAQEPFFLWLHLIEPHAPYDGKQPERFVGDASYDPTRRVEVRGPERRFDAIGGIPGFSRIEGRDELDYYVARYDSDVYDADAKVGRFLARIDELGLRDRTVVVIAADHGEGFGEHRYFWHGMVPFDETSHVPLMIRAPGIKPGVVKEIVSAIDVAPTLLELAGLPRRELHEGVSLVPQLRDPSLRTNRIVFTESGRSKRNRSWQRSARDQRFKLVYVPSTFERDHLELDEWMLFDLASDPGETKNVLAEHPEDAARLKAELFGWMRSESLFQAPASNLSPEELEAIRGTGYAAGEEQGEKPPAKPAKDGGGAPDGREDPGCCPADPPPGSDSRPAEDPQRDEERDDSPREQH